MTRRAAFSQADVSRAIAGAMKAARKAGLPADFYRLEIVDGKISLLPNAANAPLNDADEMERRMKDAFGE